MVKRAILNPGYISRLSFETTSLFLHARSIVYIPWDVAEYAAKCVFAPEKERIKNRQDFPPVYLGTRNQPMTIIDCRGRIVLWYLPKLLSALHRVRAEICMPLDIHADAFLL
jgi:hypothetical protein